MSPHAREHRKSCNREAVASTRRWKPIEIFYREAKSSAVCSTDIREPIDQGAPAQTMPSNSVHELTFHRSGTLYGSNCIAPDISLASFANRPANLCHHR